MGEEHLSPNNDCKEPEIEEQQTSPDVFADIAERMMSSNCQQREVPIQSLPQPVKAPAALGADSLVLSTQLGMGTMMDCGLPQMAIPQLLLSKEEEDRFRYSAHMLYDKYVRDMAALEINISHQLRMRLRRLDDLEYDVLTPMQWVRLFDGVIRELEKYILQSYRRLIKKMDIDE